MRLAIPLLATLLAVGPAFADEGDSATFDRSGFYLGAGGVYASDIFETEIEDIVEESFGASANVDVSNSWGAGGRLGYRLGSWFTAEVQYEWIDPFDVDLSGVGIPIGSASLEAQTVTLNGRLIAPTWRTQPYLLVGIGGAFYDFTDNTVGNILGGSDSKTGFAGRTGGGLDVYLTKSLVFNAEANVLLTTENFNTPAAGELDDLYYLSVGVGLRYQF
jgi:opacity protein-like surface antigen